MARVNIRDFFIKLGFDGTDVDKGLRGIEQRLGRVGKQSLNLNRQTSRAVSDQATAAQRVAKATERTTSSQRESLQNQTRAAALERRRASLQTAITRGQRASNFRLAGSQDAGIQRDARNLNNNFNTLSANAANADAAAIAKLRNQLALLNQTSNQTVTRASQVNRQLRQQAFVANGLRDSLRNLGRSYVSVFAIIGGGAAATTTGQGLIQLKASLLAASGSAAVAEEDFNFLRNESLRLGTDLMQTTRGFQQFGIAARAAGFSTEETRDLFTQATEATVAFGLSTDDQAGVFRARLLAPCIEIYM